MAKSTMKWKGCGKTHRARAFTFRQAKAPEGLYARREGKAQPGGHSLAGTGGNGV